ncbi:DctP family TRAP transporter solute-binding subunit [Chelatococcus sp. GCM10030263]|uniref:DctP family TRAP transporter solute-binding subunit n=1 Tax=Chelatococcus sp. GCM10030263 TaxID=3273387 RepID=UPI00366E7497
MSIAFACFAATTAFAQTKIQVAYGLPENSHFGDFTKAFKKELQKVSGGKFVVEELANYLGGNERAAIEAVQLGTISATQTSTATMENFVPETAVLDLPYLFRDSAHARKVQDGEIGQEILAKYEQHGLIGLAFGEAGFRGITTSNKPIRKPEDMKGLKLRTMQSDVHLRAFRALGALPTPMAFAELYTALQTGTLDGQENAIAVMVPGRLYEVQKYLSPTQHVLTNIVMVLSPSIWNDLTDEEKGWFKQAARAGVEAERARIDKEQAEGLKLMKDSGLQVVDDVDVEAFRNVLEPLYGTYYEKQFGKNLIERIRAVQ